jgi:hypothetical protein
MTHEGTTGLIRVEIEKVTANGDSAAALLTYFFLVLAGKRRNDEIRMSNDELMTKGRMTNRDLRIREYAFRVAQNLSSLSGRGLR